MNISSLERIINRHDPENDLIPDGPRVTWAEVDLAEFVLKLVDRVAELEAEIKRLKSDDDNDSWQTYGRW